MTLIVKSLRKTWFIASPGSYEGLRFRTTERLAGLAKSQI